jgi:hypothetical protein
MALVECEIIICGKRFAEYASVFLISQDVFHAPRSPNGLHANQSIDSIIDAMLAFAYSF